MLTILDTIHDVEAQALVKKLVATGAVSAEAVKSLLQEVRADTRTNIVRSVGQPLLGKTAIVTGSSRGIGKETALKLGLMGANVAVTYRKSQTEAENVVEELAAIGRKGVAIKYDMAETEDVHRLFSTTKATFGEQLDIFVANAAVSAFKPTTELQNHHFIRTFQANVFNFSIACQEAARLMKAQGSGKIVALSSFTTDKVLENMGLLAAAKASIETLVRYMAVELAPAGINVNTVVPGIVSTDSTLYYADHGAPDRYLENAIQSTPLGRLVSPAEVASVIAFLCTDDAKAIVGQRIIVDGGLTLRTF